MEKCFPPITKLEVNIDKFEVKYFTSIKVNFIIYSENSIKICFRLLIFEYPSRVVAGEVHSKGLKIKPKNIYEGKNVFSVLIPSINLRSGKYSLCYNFLNYNNNYLLASGEGNIIFNVIGSGFGEIANQINAKVV